MRKTLFASAAVLGLALAAPALAQGMTPEQYLQQALTAVQAHRTMTALTAVNNAENELLRSGVVEESAGTHNTAQSEPPAIRQTARAREAIQEHHWNQAATYIREAMAHPSAAQAGQ